LSNDDANNLLLEIERIAEDDGRYQREAYLFVYAALDFTVTRMGRRDAPSPGRHISGQQLSDGIRTYAREQFGPMAGDVFAGWGLGGTLDFGNIVYNLIDAGLMSKTDQDRLEDFRDVYAFSEAFDSRKIMDSPRGLNLESL